MPRIRTIKPEFWGDEKLAPMSPIDRLVFLGLLSFADDAGRLVDNEKSIDGFIFPESDDRSRDSLARLADNSRILRYVSESGQRIIQVANWKKHQKIDHPSKYVLPGPPRRSSRDPREDVAKSSGHDLGPVPRTSTSTSTADRGPSTVDRPVSDVRAKLKARLAIDDDRDAADALLDGVPNESTWCAEMQACLDGMAGHIQLTPEQLGQAIRDYVGNGDSSKPTLRHFKGYLSRARRPADEQGGGHGGARPTEPSPDAPSPSDVVTRIRNLSQHNGQRRFIPIVDVDALGLEIGQAYRAVGGSDRFLGTEADKLPFLIRDFGQALKDAARRRSA